MTKKVKATKKTATKSFWDKLSYWQRGGVIAMTIFLITTLINYKVNLFPPRLTSSLLLVILMLLLSFLYGSILGQLFKYLKNKKWYWLTFIVILVISLTIFYYTLVVVSLMFYYSRALAP